MKRMDAILWAALLFSALAFGAGRAEAAVEIADNAYLNYGTWVHATNAGGGHESAARAILWRKAPSAPHLFYSVYLVEAHAWSADGRVPDGGWTESDMYRWLNGFSAAESGSFYEGAFSASEKNGLRANPDGDVGSRVTLPDVYNGYARASRFGVAQYRGSGNLEHWLRRPYEDTAGTNDAWGVGVAGNEGPGVVSRVIGVRPLIELDLSSFLFRSGSGTQAAPYELYRGDDRLKPTAVVLAGDELRLGFPIPVAAFGSLPAPADFTLVRNELARRQRLAAVIDVDIPADSPNELRLRLSEAAVFQDGFNLSYALSTAPDGALAGGALVAASGERIALAPFDDLSVSNATPPTAVDILVTPSAALSTPAYRQFDAILSVSATRPTATVSLDDVTKAVGWDENLAVTWDSASSILEIHGVPTAVGRHTLHLDVIVDGTELPNVPVTVDVLPQNSLAGIEVIPSVPGPLELRTAANVTYTVGSTVADAFVELLSANRDSTWGQNGLDFGADLAGRTFRVTGTPTRTGIFPIYLRARIDGNEAEQQYDIEVVYPATNPTPDDLLVTSDLVGPILTGRPTRFTYTVDSSIQGAEVVLRNATAGENWDDVGLYLQADLENRQFTVWGIPNAAGNYTVNVEALIDGVSLPLHIESFTVGAPPNAEDVTFTPEMPRGRAYRPYRASTTVGSAIAGETVTLHDVTAGSDWLDNGLSFSHDPATRTVAVEGTPTVAGAHVLRVDVSVGETRITDATLTIRIDPEDQQPGPGNVVVTPSTADPFVVNTPADVYYTVSSGIEDAVVTLRDVRTSEGWDRNGLRLVWAGAGNGFAVYGTPRTAGAYTLLLDVMIDGTEIAGYELGVVVAPALPTAGEVTFAPPLPSARTHRPYDATTTLGSLTGGAVTLHGATPGDGWGGSGLDYSPNTTAGSIRIHGTPTNAGTFVLDLDVSVGGTRLRAVPLRMTVEPVGTTPLPTDIAVVPEASGPLTVGRSEQRNYTVTTGIADADVSLAGIRGGTGWSASGLSFAYVPARATVRGTTGASFVLFGTPRTAGDFPLLLDVEVDGAAVKGYRVNVEVVPAPTGAADITLTPPLPRARVGHPFNASTTVGSRTGESAVLNGVSESINWVASGLDYALAGETVTISGTPLRAGDYGLNLDVTIGETRIEDGALTLRVDPTDEPPSPADLLVVAETAGRFVVGEPADVRYRVTSGSTDADVSLMEVRPGPLWDLVGLAFDYNAADNTFRVSGTPEMAGSFTLLVDARVDGTLVTGHPASILVHPGSAQPTPPVVVDLIFTPPLPNAKAQRAYEAVTEAASRSGQSITLGGATAAEGWSASGLSFAADERAREISISGTPQQEGVYSLLADLTIAAAHVEDEPLVLVVDAPETRPTPDNIVLVPDPAGTLFLGRPANISYRIATGIAGASVELLRVRAVPGWERSGLSFAYDLAAGTFSVSGTPTETGTYILLLDIRVDGTLLENYAAKIVVVPDQPDTGDTDNESGGGSSGCAANNFPLALVAMAALAGIADKRKRK